jgi:hypothetical protein
MNARQSPQSRTEWRVEMFLTESVYQKPLNNWMKVLEEKRDAGFQRLLLQENFPGNFQVD